MKHAIALLIIISAVGLTSGCSMFAGQTESNIVIDNNGNVPTNRFGQPFKSKKTTSKSASVWEQATAMVAALPDTTRIEQSICGGFTFEQIAQLSASFQASIGNCLTAHQKNRPMEMMAEALKCATGGCLSDAARIANAASASIQDIQQASLGKWNAVGNFGKFSIGVVSAEKAFSNNSRDRAAASVAQAENGGVRSVGDISISSDQINGSQSNDPVSLAATGGEDFAPIAAGGGAEGSGVSTNTRSESSPITLNFGDDNNTVFATDQADAFTDTGAAQVAEPSANQNQNIEGRQNGQITADEFSGDPANSDDDGGNGLF